MTTEMGMRIVELRGALAPFSTPREGACTGRGFKVKRPRRRQRRPGVLLAAVLCLGWTVFGTPVSEVSATTGDIGFAGQSFPGVGNSPTSDKPQSKLWFNDGLWWATMFDSVSLTWHIFRLDRVTEHWVDTGTRVDDRPQTLSDALWDGQHLYIGSQWVTVSTVESPKASVSGRPARLYRYSYDAGTKTYQLDAGFPAAINNNSSESLTIDEDSTGRIWATWTQVSGSSSTGFTNAVYVNSSEDGQVWGTPTGLPVAGAHPGPDDISGIVAYGTNKIGVLWSNHLDETVYWAWRTDSQPLSNWTGGVAVHGTKRADDHVNLKAIQADAQGRVFAAVKTSYDELAGASSSSPQIELLIFKPGTGSWSSTTIGTLADCHTRPIVVLDEENAMVHVFATAPTTSGCPYSGAPGSIYEKVAPMDDPVFPPGRGTPVIRDAASAEMNNPTSSKQPVNSSTGLVVLASNTSTKRYWHADRAITPTTPVPTASFSASPTSGSPPLTVQLTDSSSGAPTAWAWNFGNGETSAEQNPSVTYTTAGTYAVSLTASNSSGSSAPATATITVTARAPTASFSASPTSGSPPLTVQLTDTSSGAPTAWAWDFGNGETSTEQNPSVTYTTAGTYTVSLTASNSSGSSAPATATITVTAPSAGIVRAGTSTSVATTSDAGLTIAAPAGTGAGDLLVSCLTLNGSSVSATGAPAGWTRLAAVTGVANPHVYGYYKVAGPSEPASYRWTYTSSVVSAGGIVRYTGASGLDAAVSTASGASATSGTVPGVTTATADAMLVGCVGINSGSTAVTISGPPGMTEAWDVGGKRHELDDGKQPTAGASGGRTWTFSASREWAGWLAALRPQ